MLKRPCNFDQMQNEWPKLVNSLEDLQDIPATTTAAWHKGGGSPYVLTNIGQVTLTPHPSKDWNIPAAWPI